MRTDRPVRSLRAACMLTGLIAMAGMLSATPASAATGPDLTIAANVPAGRYVIGEEFKVTLTITNIGDTTATAVKGNIHSSSGSYPITTLSDWAEFNPQKAGGTLAPGKSRTLVVRTKFYNWDGPPEFIVGVSDAVDADYENNNYRTPITLISPEVKDTVGGSVYADANGDGQPSAGEALAGVKVTVGYNPGITATTDADGKFVLPDVPAGIYNPSFEAPGGWKIPSSAVVKVDGTGGNNALVIRAVRPLDETLHATITLDKASYPNSGARAVITVKLQNTGDRAISGIHANCDPFGTDYDIRVTEANWGALWWNAGGASVAAHTTSTFKVIGGVPMQAAAIGRTYIDCSFYTDYSSDWPYSAARATVPGKKGPATGILGQDKNLNGKIDPGEGIPGVKAELTRDGSTIKYTATTDATGKLSFGDVPVGDYDLELLGPWTTGVFFRVWAVPFNKTYTLPANPKP